jgi:hypothetical protein
MADGPAPRVTDAARQRRRCGVVQNVLAKLGVHSRLEAVAYASKRRIF